jgi:hypothetical protein
MNGRRKLTGKRWRPVFLQALSLGANVREACETAGISRAMAYKARYGGPEFAEAWDAALDDAVDRWVEEARRRAVDGIDEPVVYQGEIKGVWVDDQGRPVGGYTPGARQIPLTVKKYSDALLITLLKAYRPERFREHRAVEYSGSVGHKVEARHEHKHAIAPDLDRMAAIVRILVECGALSPARLGLCVDAAPDQIQPVMGAAAKAPDVDLTPPADHRGL